MENTKHEPTIVCDDLLDVLSLVTPYHHNMLDWDQCAAVERVPGKVSGIYLFKGTRVPVKALFENIEDGARVADFLEWFPGVTHEQVDDVLDHAERSLAA